MPTPTYDLLASNVLSSNATSVTFSSLNTIGAGYRDLILVANGSSLSDFYPRVRFNGDTANNYFHVNMEGNGAGLGSFFGQENGLQIANGVWWATSQRNILICNFFDFATTDKHKTTLTRNNRADRGTEALAGRWASTSAITSIEFYSSNGASIASGSSFYLYGIVS